MDCNKEDALKARKIAEEKLLSENYSEAKRFILKAQKLYPDLLGLQQLLAIVDVHVNALDTATTDPHWSRILQVVPTADKTTVKRHYKKLLLMLHPDKNSFFGAASALKFVTDAWQSFLKGLGNLSSGFSTHAFDDQCVHSSSPGEFPVRSNAPEQFSNPNYSKQPRWCKWQERINTVHDGDKIYHTVANNGSKFDGSHINNVNQCNCKKMKVQKESKKKHGNKGSGCHDSHVNTNHFNYKKVKVRTDQSGKGKKNIPLRNEMGTNADAERFRHAAKRRRVPCKASAKLMNSFQNEESDSNDHCRTHANNYNPDVFPDLRKKGHETVSVDHRVWDDVLPNCKKCVRSKDHTHDDDCKGHGMSFESDQVKIGRQTFDHDECAEPVQNNNPSTRHKITHDNDSTSSKQNAQETTSKITHCNTRSFIHQDSCCGDPLRHERKLPDLQGPEIKRKAIAATTVEDDHDIESRIFKRLKVHILEGFQKEDIHDIDVKHEPNKQRKSDHESRQGNVVDLHLSVTVKLPFPEKDNPLERKVNEVTTSDCESDEPESNVDDQILVNDIYDFNKDRSGECLREGQIWALYDDQDELPRYYARVSKVVSLKPFHVQIKWLYPSKSIIKDVQPWLDAGLSYTCGEFRVGRDVSRRCSEIFSHVLAHEKGKSGPIKIYPGKGDVWALYKIWEPTKGTTWNCEPVEVMSQYNADETGVEVAPLFQVDGFTSVFFRAENEMLQFIPKSEFSRFSHQIPAHRLTGLEAAGLPKNCFDLDIAAIPWVTKNLS